MKIILILLDGLGDRSYKELDNRTPLQAADTPNLDYLASLGSNGLFHASVPGECLPSEIAHYLLFGYDINHFPGRGLLEAVGEKLPFKKADILCLSHLTNITWKNGIPILRCGRDETHGSREEIGELLNTISPYESQGINFKLTQTRRNDAVLIMSGEASPYVSDSDPIIMGNPIARVKPLKNNPEPEKAENTATAMNHYLSHCHKILSSQKQEANFLVTQRCGRRKNQEPFKERWGFSGLLIASGSVYMGLAHEISMDYIRVKNSDNPGRDLRERISMALEDKEHDFIHIHTKAPDEAAHKGGPGVKHDVITELDIGFAELIKVMEKKEDILLAVTADHSTPGISQLIHSGEPVPLIITGKNVRCDKVKNFDEINAAQGCLGFLKGRELMLMLLNYSDRSVMLSHQLGAMKHYYYPSAYEPFKLT